jgi:SAM-dependent methyltransferase
MIAAARQHTQHGDLTFRVDDAETLSTVSSNSVDKVICVGVLEHVLRPGPVLEQVARVLKTSGRFLALTLNGMYWWYRLADCLGLPTRHLSTDRRLRPAEGRQLLRQNGMTPNVGFWNFVPNGDLPDPLPTLCRCLDRIGRQTSDASFRGGLRLCGRPA